ncbi:MAG TPA: hypothetical protein VIY73_26720, partial [Polyangiaceae bacterium]
MATEPQAHLRALTVEVPEAGYVGPNGVRPPTRSDRVARSLTDVILELGLVPRDRVAEALEVSAETGQPAEQVLLSRGLISPDGVAIALAERYGLDYIDLTVFNVDMSAANLVTSQVAKRYEALPVAFVGERSLLVAMADPANVHAVDDIAILTGYEVRVAVTTSDDLAAVIARSTRVGDVVRDGVDEEPGADGDGIVELSDSATDAPVVKLVHQLV